MKSLTVWVSEPVVGNLALRTKPDGRLIPLEPAESGERTRFDARVPLPFGQDLELVSDAPLQDLVGNMLVQLPVLRTPALVGTFRDFSRSDGTLMLREVGRIVDRSDFPVLGSEPALLLDGEGVFYARVNVPPGAREVVVRARAIGSHEPGLTHFGLGPVVGLPYEKKFAFASFGFASLQRQAPASHISKAVETVVHLPNEMLAAGEAIVALRTGLVGCGGSPQVWRALIESIVVR